MKIYALIFLVIFNVGLVNYFLKLNCLCGLNKKLDIIKFFINFSIIIDLFLIYIYFFSKSNFDKMYFYASFILIPCAIFYTYIIFRYIEDLKKSKCECIDLFIVKLISYFSIFTSFAYITIAISLIIGFWAFWFIKKRIT